MNGYVFLTVQDASGRRTNTYREVGEDEAARAIEALLGGTE